MEEGNKQGHEMKLNEETNWAGVSVGIEAGVEDLFNCRPKPRWTYYLQLPADNLQ